MKTKRSFTIRLKPKRRTGHCPHRSGAGIHADRRTRRCRTRAAQNRQACQVR